MALSNTTERQTHGKVNCYQGWFWNSDKQILERWRKATA